MGVCHLMGAMGTQGGGFVPNLSQEDLLIAVDGGYETLSSWGLEPDHVVGDFDSLHYVPSLAQTIVLPVRKDETDMEFGMKLGISQGYSRFLIQGGVGGRLDHTFANFQLLRQLANENRHGILCGDGSSSTVLMEGGMVFPSSFSGTCSVFALDTQVDDVVISGLEYEVDGVSLFSHRPLGVSNAFISGKSARISVGKGAVLVLWEGVQGQEDYQEILESFFENLHQKVEIY